MKKKEHSINLHNIQQIRIIHDHHSVQISGKYRAKVE